jgi:hypothetical protein
MDNALNMSPQIGEVAQPGLISKRAFKGQAGWGQVGQQGGGKFGSSGNKNNQARGKQGRKAYDNYTKEYTQQQLTQSGNIASTGVRNQSAGTAFDTSISRYSPNQAPTINF